MKRSTLIIFMAMLCIEGILSAGIRTSGELGSYDIWADVNNDGWVNSKDAIKLGAAFGSFGVNATKASIAYDSGWINISDKAGQNVTIIHDLNSTDIMVDIQGKTTVNGGTHQTHLGLAALPTGGQGLNLSYGGPYEDSAYSMIQTSDGGYALAGYTHSLGLGGSDPWLSAAWLVKTDKRGSVQWSKTYGGLERDGAFNLVQTQDGGYALAGCTDFQHVSQDDFWLVRTDSSGNMLWDRKYGGDADDHAYGIIETADGGFAMIGYTQSFGAGSFDVWLVKTDSAGIMEWNSTYGGPLADLAYFGLVQTPEEGYVFAGGTASQTMDGWVVKTNPTGAFEWNAIIDGGGEGILEDVMMCSDGSYVAVGHNANGGWIVKVSSDGETRWQRTYGASAYNYLFSVASTTDGGYVSAGEDGSADAWLVKTDSSGEPLWQRTYGGLGEDIARSIIQDNDGDLVFTGLENSFGAGGFDFWLVKTDANGILQARQEPFPYGLSWVDSTANTVILYRGSNDTYWNFVQVRIWKPQTP